MTTKKISSVPPIGVQATAVVSGSFLTGAMVCLTGVVIPVFLDTDAESAHLLRHWVRLYHYGHIYMPVLCIATVGLYGYSSLRLKGWNSQHWTTYAAAAATTIAMVPFTWVFMAPTNNILFGWEEMATAGAPVAELDAVRKVVVKWAWLHLARSVFPLIGVIVGFTGILQERLHTSTPCAFFTHKRDPLMPVIINPSVLCP
ncbi:conserved hypothetical protein [Talaromyces stipitatus ATCC 10500]|uniref:DUF1772-domain-containing protein n=1 Tax=Talaromyces stipitatus (strain ATCC 10500 / CBS 375.48 / QM 6759 / NRRL 1006) TaxID=441959 RepID=B8MCR4_TALSN|nr:uncharacterized protein TSTA_126740 [Talaromyces stipitatus ATCC 10500]EED18966.1 conserved hypothetical protein [Talaromyces stipitatus ATCC 10500]